MSATACRRKRNGNTRRGRVPRARIPLATMPPGWDSMRGMTAIQERQHILLARSRPMPGASMTCTAMSGSGYRIGMTGIITAAVLPPIRAGHHQARTGCFGAAVGAASPRAAARPTATSTRRTTGASTLVSGLLSPQGNSRREPARRPHGTPWKGAEAEDRWVMRGRGPRSFELAAAKPPRDTKNHGRGNPMPLQYKFFPSPSLMA